MKLVCSLLFLIASLAIAGETDQVTCRVTQPGCPKSLLDLPDSSGVFNLWVNENLTAALADINEEAASASEEERVQVVADFFNGGWHSIAYSTVENWYFFSLEKRFTLGNSFSGIYSGTNFFDMSWAYFCFLFATLKMGGVLLGMDKLSHFFAQGAELYVEYSKDHSYDRAREYGVQTELGILGYKVPGVFSYADLAANWAGFQFYRELFSKTFLKNGGRWVFAHPFDIREYITDEWDEVLNPNIYFTKDFTGKVHRNYEKHCGIYRTDPKKFMNRTGRSLIESYTLMDPAEARRRRIQKRNSIEEICSKAK